jgi:hypothetical protein
MPQMNITRIAGYAGDNTFSVPADGWVTAITVNGSAAGVTFTNNTDGTGRVVITAPAIGVGNTLVATVQEPIGDSAIPARDGFVVTPSDSVNLPVPARSLHISTAGSLTIINLSGITVDFPNVPVGELRVGALRVLATGTTAAGIRALL